MSNQTSQVLTVDKLETVLHVHQLLAISEHKRSGLIICKAHHAEFAGPGAAVGTLVEQACVGIIAIGAPEIVSVTTHKQRQTAYSRRIQWIRWLQKITEHTGAIERTEKLFTSFEEFFGAQALMGLSDEVLALLIGVLPKTIATVRSHYPFPDSFDVVDMPSTYASVNINALFLNSNSSLSRVSASNHTSAVACSGVFKTLYNAPLTGSPSTLL